MRYSRAEVAGISRRGVLGAAAALIAVTAAMLAARGTHESQARDVTRALDACLRSPREGAAPCLLEHVAPPDLEEALFLAPALAPETLAILAGALPSPLGDALGAYVADAARVRSRRLSAMGAWSDDQGEAFLTLQLLDPARFVEDAAFRARILALLPAAFDPSASAALRDQMLYSINSIPGVDYASSEQIELGWGAAARASGLREVPYARDVLTFPDDSSGMITASIFSFPGPFLDPESVIRFMAGVRRLRPDRALLTLVDLPMRKAVAAEARASAWTLMETHGRGFSPWPRDPFSVLRRVDGGVTFLVRPNDQPRRTDDNDMAREVIQGLPDRLDAAWRKPTWTRGPVPFHNGQILLARDAAWVSAFTVERRALEILGVTTGPSEGVTTPAEWRAFRDASLRAVRELGALYRKPVRLVHDVPADLVPGAIDRLAGGGGFDLDSLVTVLDRTGAAPRMLVADIARGQALIADAPAADLATFGAAYSLDGGADAIREQLVAAQNSARARGLARFLDDIALHLEAGGASVERLPLFFVPVALLTEGERAHLQHADFLVTWNNVVLEPAGGTRRAEGFTSMLEAGDRQARAAFQRAGYAMDFAPLLPQSVILNGGYRCASQHLR